MLRPGKLANEMQERNSGEPLFEGVPSPAVKGPRGPPPPADGPHLFRISIDVRSFKATRKLPVPVASVYAKVSLPHEFVALAGTAEKKGGGSRTANLTAPLRTHPPVEVQRGTEVAINNGYLALELPATIMEMATILAQGPRLIAEVCHRDKYAADRVIGLASIPMTPLLEEPWLDGYAPVAAKGSAGQEKVVIGNLRILLAIEELGALPETHTVVHRKTDSSSRIRIQSTDSSRIIGELADTLPQVAPEPRASVSLTSVKPAPDDTQSPPESRPETSERPQGEPVEIQPPSTEESGPEEALGVPEEEQVHKGPEYEVAWELEMWKRAEEAKWRAELKEKEGARMAILEEEWRQRERERVAEVNAIRAEQAALEAKLKGALASAEEREKKLIAAEEAAASRREALEREHALRTADAKAALKRLQAELDHTVSLEKSRSAELQKQKAEVEERLTRAESARVRLEKEFADYKAAQRALPEAELAGQVAALKAKCVDLERTAERALSAKRQYKAQVLRMARELAAMQKQRTAEESARLAQERRKLEAQVAATAAQREVGRTREDWLELQRLKEQLGRLQLQDQNSAAATATAVAAAVSAVIRPAPSEAKAQRGEAEQESLSAKRVPLKEENGQNDKKLNDKSVQAEDFSAKAHEQGPRIEKAEDWSWLDCGPKAAKGRGANPEVVRLLKERAALLRTGVYKRGDKVIERFEKEIQKLLAGSTYPKSDVM